MDHARGEDVRELLAVFDAMATAAGEERERCIGELQCMARSGVLLPAEASTDPRSAGAAQR